MGPLRGVMDAADDDGRRNAYMHLLHRKAVERELGTLHSAHRALDFGCGTGRFLSTLGRRFAEVYALDREPEMLAAARAYAGQFAKDFVHWTGNATPFAAHFFDFILCSSVLGVTAAELFSSSILEISRICKPAATVLLLEQVAESRNLSLNRYRSQLRKARLTLVRAYPIRPAVSPFTALITTKKWIPRACFGGIASMEIAATSNGLYRSAEPYVEYVMVARRF